MEKLTEKDFDKVYALLKQSFIDDELRPYDEQRALLKEPIYEIYAERAEHSDELKAMLAVWDFETFVFIDYLAVHPAYRNQQLGNKILEALSAMTPKDICLEIETPKDELTFRRLEFYRRNHFVLCDFPYDQPPIAKGNAPVALSLMSSAPILEKEKFEHIKSEIYKYAYERFN